MCIRNNAIGNKRVMCCAQLNKFVAKWYLIALIHPHDILRKLSCVYHLSLPSLMPNFASQGVKLDSCFALDKLFIQSVTINSYNVNSVALLL